MSELTFARLEAVFDEETFLSFVKALAQDARAADALPVSIDGHQGEWANPSSREFLEAAQAWALDSGFGLRPGPKLTNPWQLFASFLWAGRGYE